MSCSSPRQSRDFTSPRMANRGISRQDTQPPRNQKDPALHQGPPELFRSGSPPDLSFDWRLSPALLFPSDGAKPFAISSEKADARWPRPSPRVSFGIRPLRRLNM